MENNDASNWLAELNVQGAKQSAMQSGSTGKKVASLRI
jgi:hypothetical protein